MIYLLAGLAVASPGQDDPPPSLSICKFAHASTVIEDVRELPKSIQDQMRTMLPGIAARGAKFQKGDVLSEPSLPTRRFIGAVHRGNTWVISYEHSQGYVYHVHAVVFGRAASEDFRVIPHGNLTGPLCATVDAALSGVRAADPGHF